MYSKCREKLKSATDEKSKKETLLNIYNRFRPTFRHFFIEKFADSSMWMNARLAYTHSVAVTSIVGYILGKVKRRKEGGRTYIV
jgi:serine-protein kinase ATM